MLDSPPTTKKKTKWPCPTCGSSNTEMRSRLWSTAPGEEHEVIAWRTYRCNNCGAKFSTFEVYEHATSPGSVDEP